MLYKGIFNWYCETHVLYTKAKNKDLAFNIFIIHLSKLLKRNRSSVYAYFLMGNSDNWNIKEEKEN